MLKHKPYQKLKGVMTEKSITYADFSRVLGISITAVNNKINGKSDFLLSEVEIINKAFDIETKFFCA